jgi:hypothetical protein
VITARQIFDDMKTFDPDRTVAMVQLMTDGDPAGDDVCKAYSRICGSIEGRPVLARRPS